MNRIRSFLLGIAARRPPDFVIGGTERPYLLRWWLIPRNRFFNIYLHLFLRSDDDRALHDHPWLFNASWLIDGTYLEHTIREGGVGVQVQRCAGDFKFRWGPAPHRIELLQPVFAIGNGPARPIAGPAIACWTVFITGPVVREWGFHCPRGWVPWRKFTAADDPGSIGRGCDA